MRLDDRARERETETRAAPRRGHAAMEPLEDLRPLLERDAGAMGGDAHAGHPVARGRVELDRGARGRVPQRVVAPGVEDPLDPAPLIGPDGPVVHPRPAPHATPVA